MTAEAVLRHYLSAFEKWWSRWRCYDFQVIQTAWAARTMHVPGDLLNLLRGGETVEARYKGLGPDGALVVEGPDGLETHIVSGELFAEPTDAPNNTD